MKALAQSVIAIALVASLAHAQTAAPNAVASNTPRRSIAKPDQNAEMSAALRNLIGLQEKYWADHGSYTTDGAALGTHPAPKDQAAFVQVIFAGSRGWTGMATYRGVKGKSCVIYIGIASELPNIPETSDSHTPATAEAVPACDTP